MALNVRIELADTDEIVIRCRKVNADAYALQSAIENAVQSEQYITLLSGSTEYFVRRDEILFFESSDGKVYAHTADKTLVAPYKLFELEALMPPYFVRVSKSVIANINHIGSLKREVVGNGELLFRGCDKKTYFSRAYYKLLRYKIEEMRLKK